jgi:hypothetical protein
VLAIVAGCAGGARREPADVSAPAPTNAAIVADVRLRRSAELIGGADHARLLDGELTVEFRSGKGPALEAGAITLDGKPLERVSGRGGTHYRLDRQSLERLPAPGGDGWVELTVGGASGIAPASLRVQLAPMPSVVQPTSGQTVLRSEALRVACNGLASGLNARVSLQAQEGTFTPFDHGAGRWEFPADVLAPLTPGDARVVIEMETSCPACPGAPGLEVRWSSRAELQIRVLLF